MKAYDVPVKITADGKIEFLMMIADALPRDPGDPDEVADWQRLTAAQFLACYSDADAIYDKVN